MADVYNVGLASAACAAALVYGYLGVVFTRSLYFAVAVFVAPWVVIAAQDAFTADNALLYTGAAIRTFIADVYWAVPLTAIMSAAIALAYVKVLDLGQPIDVMVTSQNPDTSHQELHIPFITAAVGVGFVAYMYSFERITDTFAYGELSVPMGLEIAIILVALAVAVAFLALHAVCRYTGKNAAWDAPTVYYTFVLAILVVIEAVATFNFWDALWHLIGLIGVALLLLVFGAVIESQSHGNWRGRFTVYESNGWLLSAVRIFFVLLGLGLLVGLGHIGRATSTTRPIDMIQVFAWPLLIALVVIVIVYIIVLVWNRSRRRETGSATNPGEPEKGTKNETRMTLDVPASFFVTGGSRTNVARRRHVSGAPSLRLEF